MAIVTRTTAKSYFETGDKPTQAQFGDFIDSALFYEDTSDLGRSIISASAAVSARTILGAGAVGGNLFIAITTASAQNQLGGGTIGKTLFETVTTASAQTQIGGGAVGRQVFEAVTTASAVAQLGLTNISNPVGTFIQYAASAAPTDYLACDGAAISRSTYADLFAVVGTIWGSGNGSTTFNLPDGRAEFIRGWDNGRGIDSGRVFGSSQTDAFQGHWHDIRYDAIGGSGGTGEVIGQAGNVGASTRSNAVRTAISDGSNGSPRIASETRSRNITALICIKYR